METIAIYMAKMFSDSFYKMVISKPCEKTGSLKRVEIAPMRDKFQIMRFEGAQVFHQNVTMKEAIDICIRYFGSVFLQINAWDSTYEYSLMINKSGKISFAHKKSESTNPELNITHDRKKNYLIEEGKTVQPLIDMGIFTPSGQVVKSMYNKFKQINRFIEMIDDVIPDTIRTLNIIDFGCGKSYLTFIIYYYFTYVRNIEVNITGLDLKADVIEKCNKSAQKYGYDKLKFEVGDISGYTPTTDIDMVVSLHACDTATDFALYNAIQWNAKYIFSVPCCQHELNKQMESQSLPILMKYGIVKERFAALMTDAIRANLLEHVGYKTQLLEFVDFAHTPKNILIRAVKTERKPDAKSQALSEVKSLMEECNFQPTLFRLLSLTNE